jgi:hypothetical protein
MTTSRGSPESPAHLARFAWAALAALSALQPACSSPHGAAKAAPADAPPVATVPPPDVKVEPIAKADAAVEAAAPAPLAGQDFIEQARDLFRLAACGGDAPVPSRFDPKLIEAHCKGLTAKYADYKTQWADVAVPYIAALRPKTLPEQEIVYPFGGGDLMTALATFPDGVTYTTISLETAGDVRKIDTITPKKLDAELALNRLHLSKLFEKVHSRTVNLDLESRSDLPGEIVFDLVALALYGFEPVSLRYFKLNADGTLHYLEAPEIRSMELTGAAKKRSPEAIQADIFGNFEMQFKKTGEPNAPVKTFRHIAYNLDDKHLKADPSLLRHLEAKGKVPMMTKAASHCLWSDDFGLIRQYVIDHLVWMISDSTGLPVRIATKAGFVQDTYGIMEWPAAFFVDNKNQPQITKDAEDMKKLWKTNPQKDLPFRYGYPDNKSHGHMMVTRPAS